MKTIGALLDAASLRKFTTLIPGRNLAHVLGEYLCAGVLHVAAISVFEHWREWGWPVWSLIPVALATILLTGCIIHRIALLGHESSHYLLLRNRKWNEIAADLLCFIPLWGSLVNYRRKHSGHHLYPNQPGKDPNLGTEAAEKLFASFPMPSPASIYKYYALFLWPPFVLRNLFQMGRVLGMGTPAGQTRTGESPAAARTAAKGGFAAGLLGMLYLLALFAVLTGARLSGQSGLVVILPLAAQALAVGVWAFLPQSMFDRQEGTLGYSKKWAGLIRLSTYAAIMMVATWVRVFFGLQLGLYYVVFWLVPLLYVLPYLMLLRELYQHANLGTGQLDNSRIIHADPFTRWALLGYGNDFHLIHHIYPNIPHYHLQAAHALLLERSEDYRNELQEVHGTVHRRGPGQNTLAESWAAGSAGKAGVQSPPAAPSVILLLLAALFSASCAPDQKPDGDQASGPAIQQLTWETKGGGQVKFRIVPDGDAAFSVHVIEHGFKAVGKQLSLTPADGDAYQVARRIFSGELPLDKETFTPQGATGSWTSITVVTAGGKSKTFDNIAPWERLKPLSAFVATKIGE